MTTQRHGEEDPRSPTVRVLHVNAGNLYGGVERILTMLARERAQCPGMEPHFAYCFEGRFSEEVRRSGAPVHVLGPVRLRSLPSVWRARRRLDALIREIRPDVLVCHSSWTLAVFGPVARRGGVATVQWLHNRTTGSQLVERLALRHPPSRIIAVSHSTAATAQHLHKDVPVNVCYAPLTADPAAFDALDRDAIRGEMAVDPADSVVIQVSRMEAWKGHREHLAALARLTDLPRWQCWFVGGAERAEEEHYVSSLRDQAKRLGIGERVRFLGRMLDVPSLLVAADLFCQPNLDTEGFSIAFTEAFLARLPIITSAIGGALELIDESCGILVPPGEVPAIADALRRLLTDTALRQRQGAAGRAKVLDRCDPRRQMASLLEILRTASAEPLTRVR